MKIYISADIEGITGVTNWNETEKGHPSYEAFAAQMTREVKAACEGAYAAGATEIYIKDAHDSARNIDMNELPENVKLHRGWSGDPMCMVSGLDESFDAALFIGYHSKGGSGSSPLAHTLSTGLEYIKINGVYASEFLINGLAAAYNGVPVVFVSGDKGLTDDINELNPSITTLPVKEGIGTSTVSIHPAKAAKETKELVLNALKANIASCRLDIPTTFEIEIAYHKHETAYRNSFYPGVKQIAPNAIAFLADDYYEVLRAFHYLT